MQVHHEKGLVWIDRRIQLVPFDGCTGSKNMDAPPAILFFYILFLDNRHPLKKTLTRFFGEIFSIILRFNCFLNIRLFPRVLFYDRVPIHPLTNVF